MRWLLDTIKGRLVVVLVVFLSMSHLLGLWLYVQKSEEATTLLHDALLAEQIAVLTRLAERLPARRARAHASGLERPDPADCRDTRSTAFGQGPPEGSRAHAFEHFLAIFLDRPTHEGIRLATSTDGRPQRGIELF